jgi:signal transduction histidine kinase
MSQKITVLMTVVLLGFVAVVGVAIIQVKNLADISARLTSANLPLIHSASNIGFLIQAQYTSAQRIILSNTTESSMSPLLNVVSFNGVEFLESGLLLQQTIAEVETRIRVLASEEGSQHTMVAENKSSLLSILFELRRSTQGYQKKVEAWLQSRPTSANTGAMLSQLSGIEVLTDKYFLAFDEMIKSVNQDTESEVFFEEKIAIGLIILTTLLALVLVLTIMYVIVRNVIAKPLQQLTDTINVFAPLHKVEESEFEKSIILRQDELGRMGRSFNRLKHDLWTQGEDLAKAINEAERANRAKSVFLASASHDLRQPLSAMQMYIAALRQKVESQDIVKIVDDIDAVSVSTTLLLNALLDVSQLEAGAIKPTKENFCVQNLLQSVARAYLPLAEEKGIRLRIVPCHVYLYSDITLVERIISNFVSNALRYTRSGSVLVGCRRRQQHLCIEVMDTGCGIPKHQLSPIFDDFYQLDNKERDRGKGLGLGLAIAKRLSICLDHDIECDSNLGRGSRFAVQVDLGYATMNPNTSTLSNLGVKSLLGERILLIEDNLEVQKASKQLLESWGCVVHCAQDAAEALAWATGASQTIPGLILADHRLPGVANGVEAAQRVCMTLGLDIPTIIVTGDVDDNHIKGIKEQGYLVLCKPVRPAKLRAAISNHL